MSNRPSSNDMRERRLQYLNRQHGDPDQGFGGEANSDDDYARRLQAQINAEIEAADRELAARMANEGSPPDLDADEAFARALEEQMRGETAEPAPRDENAEAPHQTSPPQPAPRRRHPNRPLPHLPRVAAIIKLTTRIDPSTLPPDSQDCTICAATFSTPNDSLETEYPVRFLGCSHVFGHACIQRWLRSNTNCPECRREYADELESRLDVEAECRDEVFRGAYEEGAEREEALRREEGDEGGDESGEEEGDDPFFAEPSLSQLREEREERERLVERLTGRRPRSPPPRDGNPFLPRVESSARAAPRTGFGYGRPADPLPPPGADRRPGNGPPDEDFIERYIRARNEVEAERGYRGPYRIRNPINRPPQHHATPPPGRGSAGGEDPRERMMREVTEERGYSDRYRDPMYPVRVPPRGYRSQAYPGYTLVGREATDEEIEEFERQFGPDFGFVGNGRRRR